MAKQQPDEKKGIVTKEKCFIITPIGEEGSEIRTKVNGIISVIKPILESFGYEVEIPQQMPEPGSISNQIINSILNNKLVIANLTELNPNVMYELAVRHASGLPVISLAEKGTKLPFDITQERAIFYSDNMAGSSFLASELVKAIKSIDFDKKVQDNPIYRAKQSFRIQELSVSGDQNAIVMQQLQSLSEEVSYLSRRLSEGRTKSWKNEEIKRAEEGVMSIRDLMSGSVSMNKYKYFINQKGDKVRLKNDDKSDDDDLDAVTEVTR